MSAKLLRPFVARRAITPQRLGFRYNSTEQSAEQPSPPKSNPHRNLYKGPGRTLLTNFLIATATFQLIYLSWVKLESLETKQEKENELLALEGEVKRLAGMQVKK